MATYSKDKDIELWKQWKKTGSTNDLQNLFHQMNGIINKEVGRWSGAIAKEVLEIEAASLAKKAFESYNPKSGAALSTHVTNGLQKLSRQVYTYQNVARIPEYQTLKINTFKRATNELNSQLGRDPTLAELSTHLSWSAAAVERMRKDLKREEIESVGTSSPTLGRTSSDLMVDLIYHDLNPMQKSIFEHTTGYAGAHILDGADLMKKLKLTQGQLSYEKKKIIDRVKTLGGKNL